jgi:hypothetical protein
MKFIGTSRFVTQAVTLSEVHHLGIHVLFPAFMAGNVFCRDMFHSILAQVSFYNNYLEFLCSKFIASFEGICLTSHFQALLFSDNDKTNKQSEPSRFLSLRLPDDDRFVGVDCVAMHAYLLTRWQCTMVGIYRVSADPKMDMFVLLNPTGKIRSGDSLFLLGIKAPEFDD